MGLSVRTYLGDSEEENFVLQSFHRACGGILTTLDEYKPSDIAVVFGTFKKRVPRSFARGAVIERQKECGQTIILETGYINRGSGKSNHYAVGLNGINGRADFRNKNSPQDRIEKLGVSLSEWKSGHHIVLCGQVPWDASVDFTDHEKWLLETAKSIRLKTSRPIIFRPHPLCKLKPISGTIYSTRPLEKDLKDAHACITFNSNAGVESVVHGIPAFAFDLGSMVYEVASHSLDELESPEKPDRSQWLADLTYAQWMPEEFGEAWQHFKLT